MKQTTISDFLDEVTEAIKEAYEEVKAEQDETPTDVDFESAIAADGVEPLTKTTPIDDCITTFIQHCTAQGTVPTLEQAHSIQILDRINRSYQ